MFKNDFFSTQKIIWKEIYNNDVNNIINKYLNKKKFKDEIKIYQNDGPELNSKNYKIKINKKYYLLKRWDIIYANKKTKKINPKNILNTIKMLEWINVLKGNLINTKNFLKKKKIIKYKDFYWSIFPFYEGEHYSGSNISFYKVIKTLAYNSELLLKCPFKKKLNKQRRNNYFEASKIISLMNKKYNSWDNLFGKKNSRKLKSYWPKIIEIYNYLKNNNYSKKNEPVHCDITPHNLLISKNKIFILDPDSIRIAPIGEAFAYAGLKLCKQYITKNNLKKTASKVGDNFIRIVNKNYSLGKSFSKNYYHLSLSYIFIRLMNIFRLNLKNRNNKWNDFLEIQLNHISEAEKIFKKK